MIESPPRFSVVVPTWNDAERLERALRSVLRQSFGDFELLVVDDGSTDNTRSCVEALSDSRIRYIYQGHAGVSEARNRGLQAARGHYLAFLDSDDQAHRDWLESFAEALLEDHVMIVCCGLYVHDTKGEVRTELPKRDSSLFDDQEVLFLAGTSAVRRTLLLDVGGYRTDLFFSENTELGIRLVEACRCRGQDIRTIQRPLLTYHPRELPHLKARRQRHQHRLDAIRILLAAHSERFQRDPALHAMHLAQAGTTAVRAGRPDESHRFFHKALRLRPWSWKHYARWLISFLPGVRSVVWKP